MAEYAAQGGARTDIGTAVQIVNVRSLPTGLSQFVLEKASFRHILKSIGDRHVYILSIAGASRQGKSFLMNVIRHFLEEMEKGEDNPWTNISQKESLEGFHIENRNVRDTIGFWIWSKPFIFKQSNGKEIAVLLMDTQGVFDKFTNKKEWSMIVGLSLLTSSCVIYNLLNNLLEDNLDIFNNFVEFGMMTLKTDTSATSAFHKLLFLIRDWGFPNDSAYGAVGGNQFIKNHMNVLPDMSEESQKIRKTLPTVFDEIECFLMPHPGNAAKQNDYTGSLRNLDPEFLYHLEAFLSNLLVIDELRPLTIGGRKMRGEDLLSYFSNYIEVLNKQNLPNATSLFDKTKEAELQAVTQEYVATVKQKIEDCISQNEFLSEIHLKQEYENTCKQVLSRFTEMHYDESPHLASKYTKMLVQELRQLFPKLFQRNVEGKAKYISELLESSEVAYKQKVLTSMKGTVHSSQDMDSILANCREQVIQDLNLGNRDKAFFEEVCPQIESILESLRSTFAEENSSKLKDFTSHCRSVFDDLLKTYETKMKLFVSEDELKSMKPEKLVKFHENSEEDIIKELCHRVQFDNQNLKERIIDELKSLTSKSIRERLERNKQCRNSTVDDAMRLVQQTVDKYCMKMSSCLEEGLTDGEINSRHTALKLESKEIMFQLFSIVPNETGRFMEALENKITESFEEFKSQLKARNNKFKSQWETEVGQAIRRHETDVKKFITRLPHPSQEDLRRFIESSQNNLVEAVNDASWLSKDLKIQLQNEIQEQTTHQQANLLNFYKSVIESAEKNCSQDVTLWSQNYIQKMKEQYDKAAGTMTIQNLKAINADISSELMSSFESKWTKTLPKSSLTNSVKQLKYKLQELHSEMVKVVEKAILEQTSAIEEIIIECCDSYNSEMEDKLYDSLEFSKFENCHTFSKTKAEKEFNKQTKNFSSFPKLAVMKQKLLAEVDKAYRRKLQILQQKHDRLEDEVKRVYQESIDIYLKEFARRRPAFETERDLQPAHFELAANACKLLEQRICKFEGISVQRLFQEKMNLESLLEKELLKQREEWNSLNNAVDQKTKVAMQQIMNDYQNKMTYELAQVAFLSTENLEAIHEKLLKLGIEQIKKTKKPANADPKAYEDQLRQDLCNTYPCFVNENQSKRTKVETLLNEKIAEIKEKYSIWLAAQKHPQKQWNTKREEYIKEMKTSLKYKVTEDAQKELSEKFFQQLTSALEDAQQDWEKLGPSESDLQLAVIRSREVYEKEMNSKSNANSPLLQSSDLKQFHKRASATAMNEFESQVKQTTATRKRLEEALEAAFVRYRDENDLKAAESGQITVGIDLGTTYSCVAVYKNRTVEIIPDRNRHSGTVPSYVLFETKDRVVVGDSAKEQSVIYPHNTVFDSKRLIGRRFTDKEVQEDIKLWPFRVINDKDRPKAVVHGESFFPEEISGKILEQLKTNAELHLNHEVKRAVITVPAYFSDAQKRATRAAADFAGLEVLELLSEPTAAAIAYNFHYNDESVRNVFVYDLGGGTFDVSILASQKGKMEVKAVDGNNHLGGQDFDNAMVKYCITEFNKTHNLYLENEGEQRDKDARIRRIRNRCEAAKINLSKSETVKVIVDRLYLDKDMDVEISREEFNKMIEPMLQETIKIAKAALACAGLTAKDINDVVLVGGSSRIPRAQELLKELFERDALSMALNPDEVVAKGAAYRAAMLSGAKELASLKFNNVTPFPLGIEVVQDKFSIIIPKNTQVPCTKTSDYYTSKDFQTKLIFPIYEGEDVTASKNNLLGQFTLTNIPSERAGKQQIDVTMDLDEEGLLNVTAVCKSTGGSQDIQIETIRPGLSKDDVEKQKTRQK